MKTLTVRMAKASPEDIQAVVDFFNWLEQAVEYGNFEDKENPDDLHGDAERVGVFIEKQWKSVAGAWGRVVWGCDMLIRNLCDPTLDYLAIRPDMRDWMDWQERSDD